MTNPLYDPFAVLQKVYGGGAYLKQALNDTPIEEAHRARTAKVCYGVLENDIYLDFCIKSFAPKSPKLPVRILLKVSLYFLLFLGKARYMVTDSAVSLIRKLGKGGASGFVNAFLRNFDAEKLILPADKLSRLSVQYSFPPFAVSRLLKEYGEEAEEIKRRGKEDGVYVYEVEFRSGNMEYEYGKYYSEGDAIYICKRGGVEDPESMYGQKVTLQYLPSALVGQYFEQVV